MISLKQKLMRKAMKKIEIALTLSFLLAFMVVKPKVGCVDNSYHLKQKYDSKEYHYVECNCPCDTHAAFGLKSKYRNKCLECGHYHYADPQSFPIQKNAMRPDTRTSPLQALIVQYKLKNRQ